MGDNLSELMRYKAALENVNKLQSKLERSGQRIEKSKMFANLNKHLQQAGKSLENFTRDLQKNVRKEMLGVTAAAMLKVDTIFGGPKLKPKSYHKPRAQKAESIIPKQPKNVRKEMLGVTAATMLKVSTIFGGPRLKSMPRKASDHTAESIIPKHPKNIRERILSKHFAEKPSPMVRWLQGTRVNKWYQNTRAPLGKQPFHESAIGKGLGKGIGKGIENGLGLIAPVANAFLEAASTSSQSFGIIRSGTGATKETIDSLMTSFRKVGSEVPQSLSEVAKSVAVIYKQTGMTGDSLESFTKTALDVSRVIGADSTKTAESATKAMGVWEIGAENSRQMLDKFFVASRLTDTGMVDLMQRMTQFGTPLKSMGIGFDQALALMGKWESGGINSLQDALVSKLPAGGISEVAEQIKNAGTAMEQAQIAATYFGSTVAQDLVSVLNGSKVEFKGVLDALNSSDGSISKYTESVQSFGDRWDTLKNKMSLAMAPVGEIILPAGEKLVAMIEWIKKYADILIPSFSAMGAVLLGFLVPSLWASAVAGWAVIAPFLPIIAVIALVGAAIAGLAYLYHYKMDEIKQFTEDVLHWIRGQWEKFTNFFNGVVEGFSSLFSSKNGISIQGSASVSSQGSVMNGAAQPAGSFYHGLDYVPYDGMLARLHKGERVLTARENQAFSQGQSGSVAITITGNTFQVRQESDIDSIARALAREIKAAGGLMA